MATIQRGGRRLAGAAARRGQGGRVLTHVTRPELERAILRGGQVASEVVPPNTLLRVPGKGLYAFGGAGPISKLWKFFGGLDPRYTVEIAIPEGATGAFRALALTGPWNLIRRLAGVRVAQGSVDLATGTFTPYATGRFAWLTKTTERWIVAADLGLDAAIAWGISEAAVDGE